MLTKFFDHITELSLRFRWITIALTAVIIIAGIIAMTGLNQELVPRVEFPQTVIVAQWPDAETPEQFLDEVTIPLENAFADVDGVVNVESTTSGGFAFIIVRNDFGLDQDRVLKRLDEATASVALPDEAETELLNFSFSDFPVVVASVSSSELTLPELKALIEEEIQPQLATLDEVSEVSVGGGQELPEEVVIAEETAVEEVAIEEEVAEETASSTAVEPEPEVEIIEEPEVVEDPGRLPGIVTTGGEALGVKIEYAQDVTVELLRSLSDNENAATVILNILRLVPHETLVYLPADTISYLPSEFTSTLPEDVLTELNDLSADFGGTGQYTAEEAVDALQADTVVEGEVAQEGEVAEEAVAPTLTPVPLPDSWIAAAAAIGQEIEDTSDISVEFMEGIVSFAPEQLAELTDEMWRALDPAVTAVALPAVEESLSPDLLAQLQAQEAAYLGEAPEPAPLPDAWIAAAAAAGQEIATTDDIPAEMFGQFVSFAPELVEELTPEVILALPAEALAALPADYVTTLDAGLQQTIANIIILNEAFTLVQESGDGEAVSEVVEPEPEPVDPARLPDVLVQGAAGAGFEIENSKDITPDLIRLFAGLGPQGVQVLQLLTPDNLRLLNPEVIALLPADFIATLDADLLVELDEIAAEFGGAGQLAIAEAEEAAQLAEGSPDLSGIWLEPNPEGEPSQFQTAADLINNPFAPGAAAFLNFFPTAPNVENPAEWMGALTPEVLQFLADNEENFVENLEPIVLELLAPETITFLLDNYPNAFDAELTERLVGIAQGDIEVFVPEASVTRTDGNPSVIVNVFKDGDANTVVVAHRVFEALAEIEADYPDLETNLVFEQATFIEDSIEGVSREGILGALFAVLVIMAFLSGRIGSKFKLSWRATLVTAVSIPLSIFAALLLMRILPPTVGVALEDAAANSDNGLLTFLSRLFPSQLTLNIMTLSGLTVAIGRVVDDSIVVLENSYRYIQKGIDTREAVLKGTREVAVAIFSATMITMAVFLPLGLIGGIVGSFFLPFGLAVAYALAASFVVSITAVPALTYLVIRQEHIPDERETAMQRWYTPILEWSLRNRFATMLIALVIFLGSMLLLGQLPQSFIPSFGDPTVNVSISLPAGTQMVETNELVEQFEAIASDIDGVDTIQTEIGSGGGFEAFFGGAGVSQNVGVVTISVDEEADINALTNEVRQEAIDVFGEENVVVAAAAQSGFSGFALIVTGDSLEELRALNDEVKAALGQVDVDGDGVPDIANVSSNADTEGEGVAETIIRIDGRPAISFSGDLETDNTIGVTTEAKTAVEALNLPAGVEVTEGFDSEQQLEGFRGMITALGYSIIIAYAIMAITFRSLIHPFTILFSIPFALVGAAIALFITNSVLGISAMIGFMMLIGVVVTNGIVLMELVQQLRERGTAVYDSLVDAGRTRLRPIWMTALTAILALIPLAVSSEAGAIIASELARAVMGGLIVSTALTLIVVPVVYSLSDQFANWVNSLFRRTSEATAD